MARYLHLDFETFSEAKLGDKDSVGLHNYVLHPSTRALMLAWAYDDEDVELWEPHLGPMPARLREGLDDPNIQLAAWNSAFERYVFNFVIKMLLPIERFVDPQASARYLSLPGSLEDVGKILGLPQDLQKDKEGKRLIHLFSEPQIKRRKGEATTSVRDWNTDPEDWKKFGGYCRKDVVAEREIMRRLKALEVFPLPERERRIWICDQRINDRGIPVDRGFVEKAYRLATEEKKESLRFMDSLTGLKNSNSRDQMLGWAKSQGYAKKTLKKETVAAELKFNENLTPLCCQVLELRKAVGSTSYKKLATLLRQLSPDDRLRNQFVYMGSSRCGRWSSSGGIQFQNQARPAPEFEDEKVLALARKLIYSENYNEIKSRFGSVLTTVKSCLRTCFVAKPGKKFAVCDLSAIETRVGAWVSGCGSLMGVFKNKRDPYLDYAMKMTKIPYEKLEADLKSKDPKVKTLAKGRRQTAKPVVLGCVYRLGGGGMGMKKGDPVKTGLWGYAENYGVEMTQQEAADHVKTFRSSYPEIPEFWYACEDVVKDVLVGVRTKRELGPDGCVKIDKITERPILRIQFPNDRFLHYVDASIQDTKMPWQKDGADVHKPTLVYSGKNQESHKWENGITSHGGKLTENIVQGIARDVIAEDMLLCEEKGIEIVAHAHDELIAEIDDNPFALGLQDMMEIMSRPIGWLPGLILAGDGFECQHYRKG